MLSRAEEEHSRSKSAEEFQQYYKFLSVFKSTVQPWHLKKNHKIVILLIDTLWSPQTCPGCELEVIRVLVC